MRFDIVSIIAIISLPERSILKLSDAFTSQKKKEEVMHSKEEAKRLRKILEAHSGSSFSYLSIHLISRH